MVDRKVTLIILLILCSMLVALPNTEIVRAAEDSWTTMEPMLTARIGFGVAVLNGKVYAIGGSGILNINEEYDPVTNTWTTKKSMPTPRSSFGIAVVENKIYVIGGSTGNYMYTGVNEVYDPSTDTWETKTLMPTPRNGIDANVVNGKIYVIGGGQSTPNINFDINEVYDPATDSWTTKTPIPTGVEGYASAVVDNRIYIMGGAVGVSLNQVYDSETDTWSSGASLPTVVDSAAAGATTGVMAPKRIYVIGGKQGIDAVNLNQIYDPESDTWTYGTSMPTLRMGLAVAVVNDTLYAIGGREGWLDAPITAANERYTPADYIPEFPSWIILPLFLTATLFSVIIKKRLFRSSP